MQTLLTQTVLIWIQTVWLSDSVPELFLQSYFLKEMTADYNKSMESNSSSLILKTEK